MSDFKDSAESNGSRVEKGSLLERGWRDLESDSVEGKGLAARQRFFEGASSMVDLTNHPAAKDESPTATLEQNLRKLLQDVEKNRQARQPSTEKDLVPDPPYLNRFLERARTLYEKQEFKSCLEILHEAHKLAPGSSEVLSLIERVEQESQLQHDESDFASRIVQFKAESLKLFEHGRYSECVERFKLLTELDPENYDLRDYLEISIEEAEKQKRSQRNVRIISTQENRDAAAPTPLTRRVPAPASFHAEPPPSPPLNEPRGPDDSMTPLTPDSPLTSNQVIVVEGAKSEPESKPPAEKLLNEGPPRSVEVRSRDLSAERNTAEHERVLAEMTSTPEEMGQAGAKKLKLVYLVGAGLLFGSILGIWLVLGPLRQSRSLEVQPQANSNSVVPVDRPRPLIDLSKSAEGDEHAQAEKAFKQGRFMEANRLCESILQGNPNNSSALSLKQEIHGRLSGLGNRDMANRNWEKAIALWNDVLRINPKDREAARQLNTAKTNLKKQTQMDLASKQALEKKIQDLHQQITVAFSAGRYLPPSPGNAIELIQKLEAISPDKTFGKEKLDQILRNLIAQANRSLQARDYASASTLAKQMQIYFPEAPELKALSEGIKAEEARLAETRNSWMQKAETAMAAGHYVTPATDNVIAYCNLLLATQPQNPKVLELKREGFAKAVSQAKALVQDGKYDDAKSVYSVLLYLPQNENPVPLSSSDLKREIDRLTFNAYAVVHDHTIGSCTGRLRFNGYQIAYLPTTDSKDGFVLKLSEIVQIELGDKLKIQFKSKTCRFQDNGPKNAQESRSKMGEIHQRLIALTSSSQ
jgi:tetratricopeptide (TPR) repeat protein